MEDGSFLDGRRRRVVAPAQHWSLAKVSKFSISRVVGTFISAKVVNCRKGGCRLIATENREELPVAAATAAIAAPTVAADVALMPPRGGPMPKIDTDPLTDAGLVSDDRHIQLKVKTSLAVECNSRFKHPFPCEH